MYSIDLGEYGIPLVFEQEMNLTNSKIYILYTKPSGGTGQWIATKEDSTTFYYNLQEGDIDEIGRWVLWIVAKWTDKLLWDRVSLFVKNAPTSRIPT